MKTLFKNLARIFNSHQRRCKKHHSWLAMVFMVFGMSSTSLLAQQTGDNTITPQNQNTIVSKQGVLQTSGADVLNVVGEYVSTVFTGIEVMFPCMLLESIVKTIQGSDAAAETAKLLVQAGAGAAETTGIEAAGIEAAGIEAAGIGALGVAAAPVDLAVLGVVAGLEVEPLLVAAGEKGVSEVAAVAAPFFTRLSNNVVAKFARSRVSANLKFLSINSILTAVFNLFGTSAMMEASSNDVSPLEMLSLQALQDSSEFVTVGDPNNAADPLTGLGAVVDAFQIGTYDVTVTEWALFLTAVKATEHDKRHLYHPQKSVRETGSYNFFNPFENQGSICYVTDSENTLFCTDSDGESTYYQSMRFPSPVAFPITGISLDDAKRYCNWRHHGSPIIEELNDETVAITETGAYDFTDDPEGDLCEGASYFLPTLNQWYKAAYYKGGGTNTGYWKYPLQIDSLPFLASIDTLLKAEAVRKGANFATITPGWFYNTTTYYTQEAPYLTPIGFFKDAPGPYGTYDLGGNVRQWTSDLIQTKQGPQAIAPGGSWSETGDALLNTHSHISFNLAGGPTIGLRICARADQAQQNSGEINQQAAYQQSANMLQRQQQQGISRAEIFCSLVALGVFNEAVAFFALEVPDAMNGLEKQTWEQVFARWDLSRWAINIIYVVSTSAQNAARDVPIPH